MTEQPDEYGVDSESTMDSERTVAELEDRWRRALADLDNLRKRYARELDRERADERGRVALAWLPVLDNLELALDHVQRDLSHDAGTLAQGLLAVRDQAIVVLSGLGYERYDETGVPFDPVRHEAVVARTEDKLPPGTVLEVLRAGYGDGKRQLRPAAVVVSAAPADQAE
ncbi:nucleotide exchange factor GrpE [Phytohabitans flavus]|uniref:Protein GrpE n=1 Tax=Phytohabitans flavus TaxID=1076124 RepID=A0A6F8XIZ2_9ACTN|nr:nucleotide exchange factor GrpE [Phytohabitans flavus]BCB73780.1 protein GrpE [Phytohabitans flavus]